MLPKDAGFPGFVIICAGLIITIYKLSQIMTPLYIEGASIHR